jgi:hypothetical protein
MRYLTIDEVLDLHHLLLEQSGGAPGVLNQGAVESAVAHRPKLPPEAASP